MTSRSGSPPPVAPPSARLFQAIPPPPRTHTDRRTATVGILFRPRAGAAPVGRIPDSSIMSSRVTDGAEHVPANGLPRLPDSPTAFMDATWDDVAPYYDALAAAEITPGRERDWLTVWSELDAMLGEAG